MHDIGYWSRSWVFGVPLIALTVVVHVIGLSLIRVAFARAFGRRDMRRAASTLRFAVVMGAATALVTLLHVVQGAIWAAAYVLLGALPDPHEAMLYSLGAMTAYGHAAVFLAPAWQMLGALEALNGLILFGLTTAFLYGMIQQAWPGHE
ncbi:hypothetical protein [Neoroseomonas soli]|uniref:Two pore domain potassium channel family protein n=1 Tax=Neoroseomonas soli TaxID=1081025 RepID=A0A9X9WYB7_9PROT|nr:hypothetical protein [Neoroseomonas soli]MBR0672146.1 hypothetical protein [Neoroseomonas soli]